MTTLYAQPYDISATGFYFETIDAYQDKAARNFNHWGAPVEEYEIQFIDGECIDAELAQAWDVNQANMSGFLEAVDEWDNDQKRRYIIAVGECGYDHAQVADDPERVEIDIYYENTMRDLAMSFVEEGLFGDIPDHLAHYLDYDAMARDLSMDYAETTIAGEHLIYACR